MKKYHFILFIFISALSFAQNNLSNEEIKKQEPYFKLPANINSEDYLPQTIIFKIKPEFRAICENNRIDHAALRATLDELDISTLEKKFPGKIQPDRAMNERGGNLVDLSLIYYLNYNADFNLEQAINNLYNTGIIEYAEPQFLPKLYYTVDDSENGVVYALSKMNVFAAWDISKGDTNVVIGITDTGVDFDHPDLKANIKYNYNDTINGIDDDGDDYIDNFRGWDLGQNDNDPQYYVNDHGVHVSGTAAASTNNTIGISGVGFKCKFLPVKISNSNGTLTGSYEGIVYAADHGCHIINCSWGGVWGGQYGQDIINYATINKNSLVVCAAGNDNVQDPNFPSSYDNAFSIASTNRSDVKSGFSNYGYHIDVSAPGSGIYSTIPGNTYGYKDGTSMAAPNAAGAAAIVKSHFPSYSALQVGEQLKVTTDKIDNSNSNSLRDKLGTGRINLHRALTDTTSPSVVMTERTITINNGNAYHFGDTIVITGEFLNYLAPTVNLSANLTTTSSYVSIINGNKILGVIPTYGTTDINNEPFKVVIKSNAPLTFKVPFKLTLSDGSYASRIYFEVELNLNKFYINIAINDVNTSITSRGKIGYLNESGVNGLGYKYMGSQMLYEGGFIMGVSDQAVSSSIKGSSTSQNDFATNEKVITIPNVVSEFDVIGSFNDNNAANPLNVVVKHGSFAWSSPGNRKFVIFNYNIKNTGSATLNDFYAGIFADWNIMNKTLNKADFDAFNKMGFVWSTEANGKYAGIKLLSTTASVNHYAIDNVSGGNGGIDVTDGFNIQEKYLALSSNRSQAGINAGADVISIVSSGPYSILPGDSAIMAFALLAGDSLEDLQASAAAAQVKYDSEILPLFISSIKPAEELWLGQAYPNPAVNNVMLELVLPQSAVVQLSLYNCLGQETLLLNKSMDKGKHSFNVDLSHFPSGIYIYKLNAGGYSQNGKFTVVKL